jgi:hypothetical protein
VGQFVDLLARATVLVCQEKMPDYEVTETSERPRTGWGEVGNGRNDGSQKIGGSTRKYLGGNRI